jgi:hypothetical protein
MNALIIIYPIFIRVIIILLIISIAVNLKSFILKLKNIKKKTLLFLIIIFIISLIIRLFLINHTHYLYYEEFDHFSFSRNVLHLNRYSDCLYGNNNFCEYDQFTSYPPSYHVTLSEFLRLFGDSEKTGYLFSIIIGSISVILSFILLFFILNDEKSALIGCLFFSLIPTYIKYSGSFSVNLFSSFSLLIFLIFLELFLFKKNIKSLYGLLISLIYYIYSRPENIFIFIIVMPYLFINIISKKCFKFKIKNKQKWILSFIFLLILLIPIFLQLYFSLNIKETQGWNDSIIERINFLKLNLTSNLSFFYDLNYNSFLLPIFSLLGLFYFFKNKSKNIFYLSLFLLFLFIFSSYHIGEFHTHYNASRYSIILFIPLCIFFSYGIKLSYILLEKTKLNAFFSFIFIIILFISIIPSLQYINFKSNDDKIYQFILSSKTKIPSDYYVISRIPSSIITTIDRKAIHPDIFNSLNSSKKKNMNFILFKDFWWYTDEKDKLNNFEQQLKTEYNFELICNSSENYYFYKLNIK